MVHREFEMQAMLGGCEHQHTDEEDDILMDRQLGASFA